MFLRTGRMAGVRFAGLTADAEGNLYEVTYQGGPGVVKIYLSWIPRGARRYSTRSREGRMGSNHRRM